MFRLGQHHPWSIFKSVILKGRRSFKTRSSRTPWSCLHAVFSASHTMRHFSTRYQVPVPETGPGIALPSLLILTSSLISLLTFSSFPPVSSLISINLPISKASTSRDMAMPTLGGQVTFLAPQVFLDLGSNPLCAVWATYFCWTYDSSGNCDVYISSLCLLPHWTVKC